MNRHFTLHLTALLLMLLCFASPAAAQERFSRGIEMNKFIPKGQWITGVNVSYTQSDQDNYQFLIIENIKGDTYSFKVSPMLLYAFQDNLALGGRFSYSRSRTHLDNASLILDSETSYDINNLYSISHNYSGYVAFRNYISLGNSMRFAFFNELQLSIGGGQSKLINGKDDITGTYQRSFDIGVGLTPGMMMFLNNYSAIEVSIGVLGFDYSSSKATTDQIYVAHTDYKSANFKINLFSISFGVVFYL
ncbi:MAG: outer membrane beta-barrel protein [Barnesiella sp.]|nr:outer membrane beta-barrel protein [Barnesiella sp.]